MPHPALAYAPATSGDALRGVLSHFPTGVVAVTGLDSCGGRLTCLVVNSFTSVSLDPPLVAICVANTSTSWSRLRRSSWLCMNILAEDQAAVSGRLAVRNPDKLAGVGWRRSPGGAPVLDGALAWLECTVRSESAAGDHVIVVADIHACRSVRAENPLIFFRSGYRRLAPAGEGD